MTNDKHSPVTKAVVLAGIRSASAAGHLNVQSKSAPGEFHRLTVIDNAAVACTCKGFKFYGRCYHKADFNAMVDAVD